MEDVASAWQGDKKIIYFYTEVDRTGFNWISYTYFKSLNILS